MRAGGQGGQEDHGRHRVERLRQQVRFPALFTRKPKRISEPLVLSAILLSHIWHTLRSVVLSCLTGIAALVTDVEKVGFGICSRGFGGFGLLAVAVLGAVGVVCFVHPSTHA
jgi:hypothetical protein